MTASRRLLEHLRRLEDRHEDRGDSREDKDVVLGAAHELPPC
jgi:hypothetical protein